jgi:hypothetical protein
VTRGEHSRALGLVVVALLAATVLTLAGCGEGAKMVSEGAGKAAQKAASKVGKPASQVEDEGWDKLARDAAKEAGKEVVEQKGSEGMDVVEDAIDPDHDGDGFSDGSDNCPTTHNSTQANYDQDGYGDACDPDVDGDGVANENDRYDSDPRYY